MSSGRSGRSEPADLHRLAVMLCLPEVVLHLLGQPTLGTASDSRIAISGEIPRRPLSRSESVLRETASPFAASVTVRPRGSRHWRPAAGTCERVTRKFFGLSSQCPKRRRITFGQAQCRRRSSLRPSRRNTPCLRGSPRLEYASIHLGCRWRRRRIRPQTHTPHHGMRAWIRRLPRGRPPGWYELRACPGRPDRPSGRQTLRSISGWPLRGDAPGGSARRHPARPSRR